MNKSKNKTRAPSTSSESSLTLEEKLFLAFVGIVLGTIISILDPQELREERITSLLKGQPHEALIQIPHF